MNIYDVQITTDLGEVVVLQVSSSDEQEAEMTAISMVVSGEAGTMGRSVSDCFCVGWAALTPFVFHFHSSVNSLSAAITPTNFH